MSRFVLLNTPHSLSGPILHDIWQSNNTWSCTVGPTTTAHSDPSEIWFSDLHYCTHMAQLLELFKLDIVALKKVLCVNWYTEPLESYVWLSQFHGSWIIILWPLNYFRLFCRYQSVLWSSTNNKPQRMAHCLKGHLMVTNNTFPKGSIPTKKMEIWCMK